MNKVQNNIIPLEMGTFQNKNTIKEWFAKKK